MTSHRTATAMFAVALLLTSCATSTHPIVLTTRPTLDKRVVLEFKDHGKKYSINNVTYAGDSLSGIDWRYPNDPRQTHAMGSTLGALILVGGLTYLLVSHAVGGN